MRRKCCRSIGKSVGSVWIGQSLQADCICLRWGCQKTVLLADTFGKAVDAGYGNVAGLSGTDAWLVMLFYTLQLYFDFSGYCDMGRGIASYAWHGAAGELRFSLQGVQHH